MPETIPFPTRPTLAAPPDDAARRRALDPTRSFLVQAPAGSGKTHLLTQRFLRLLAQAQRPDEIVAITFTIAAAAEMRNRILEALEAAEENSALNHAQASSSAPEDPLSIPALASAALAHSRRMHWQLLEQPSQLRIITIDAFCRSLAMQAPLNWGLLSGLATLETTSQPEELYRRAARRLLERVIASPAATPTSIQTSLEALLLWRDNNWRDVETQIVEMLSQRNRWYQDFVFSPTIDFTHLRRRLEGPMRRAAHQALANLSLALDADPTFRDEILFIARAACENPGDLSPFSLAECAELPILAHSDPHLPPSQLEDAISLYRALACFLLTAKGAWRKTGGYQTKHGFPSGEAGKPLKARMGQLLANLAAHPALESALQAFLDPLPTAYTEDEWALIRHAFTVLTHAWAELQLLFSETGQVDFTEVAQIALRILTPSDDIPFDHALRIADGIRHLLIDEFQDTSRNQHQLLSRLIAAWPDHAGRTCFCVGDPMQSIYGFRDAEVELFERLKTHGLDLPPDPSEDPSTPNHPFRFEAIILQANFRTTPTVVRDLNQHFARILPTEAEKTGPDDVAFAPAIPVRPQSSAAITELHLDFTLSPRTDLALYPQAAPETTRQSQLDRIVTLVRQHLALAQQARIQNPATKYRIAILGRTRTPLVRIAEALRTAAIPYRAVEIVPLRERPEILDLLALARAYLNPADRRAWLGILRAPWCGLSLAELHALTSADDAQILAVSIPTLLETRLPALTGSGQITPSSAASAARLARVLSETQSRRADSATISLGTWLESLWKSLGGPFTVTEEARANLNLLFSTLDALPSTEAGLLSSELDNALAKLYALPDPAASIDFGVQLMTIHQSKGLEFEIVLVPELESTTRSTTPAMISWLERGLTGTSTAEAGENFTEFLIAPIQSKGSEAGQAKKWVDSVRKQRETLEQRRILYVAATRAREELHLFSRPCFTLGKTGQPSLGNPTGLLKTAWKAFSTQIEAAFASQILAAPAQDTTLSLAAGQAELFPAPPPTRIYRLPAHLLSTPATHTHPGASADTAPSSNAYERTRGSLYSRLQGVAIHAFLEELTRLRQSLEPNSATSALDATLPAVTALLRSRGLDPASSAALARESLTYARQVLAHPIGSWILTPHPQSSTESRWSGLIASGPTAILRHLRPDRVFFAPPHASIGPTSSIPSQPIWWIIDYKTSHTQPPPETTPAESSANQTDLPPNTPSARQRFLETHRAQHAPQLHAYAQLLRGIASNPAAEIRAGLFYPRLLLFDSWLL